MKYSSTFIALLSVFVFLGQGVIADPGLLSDILNGVGSLITGIFGNYNNGGSGVTAPSQPGGTTAAGTTAAAGTTDEYCDETTTTNPPVTYPATTTTPITTNAPVTTNPPNPITTATPTTVVTSTPCEETTPAATTSAAASGSSSGLNWISTTINNIIGWFGLKKRSLPEIEDEGFSISPEVFKRASGANSNKVAIEVALGAAAVAAILI